MSRGGAGRGRGRGGGSRVPTGPMTGLTHEEMQIAQMKREPAPLYPEYEDVPIITSITDREREIYQAQTAYVKRLKSSPYYLVDSKKIQDIPRYSDKYKPQVKKRQGLESAPMNREFFSKEIWDDYFTGEQELRAKKQKKAGKKAGGATMDLDELENADGAAEEDENAENPPDEGEENHEDYDNDEEDYGDDDYLQNYFDAGDGDDADDGEGGGED